MNPELTYSLPAYQTASGCTDIIMHTLERWFTAHTDNSELIDGIAVSVIKTVIHNAPILLKDPHNYNARAEVMWAGSLSHNGTTGPVGDGDWGSHQLEHELGGMFNVTHGAGLAAVWPAWAHYVYKDNITRFAQLAERVFGVSLDGGQEHAALEGIRLMTEFFASINMPVTLTQLGLNLSDEQCETLAYNCTWKKTRTIGAVKKLGLEDIAAIYKAAR
jgi:alcohol dehydrogenase YqhD (iron-dependent ADH family)